MQRVSTVYLALGGNLGDRLAQLRAATQALETASVRVLAKSAVYETDAVAPEPQPPYLNAALRVETTRAPAALLALALSIERELGRDRPTGATKAPRTVDIDLLLVDDLVIERPGLTIPHPALLERAFVRIPLADVAAPGLRHPRTGAPLDHAEADPGVRATSEVL